MRNYDTEHSKIAFVTGSNRGIGRRVSEWLVDAGYFVYGCSRGSSNWSVRNYRHSVCDITDEQSVVRLIRKIYRTHGQLDVAVNNAAIAFMNHSLLTPASTLQKMLNTNVVGTFTVSREAAKIMKRSGFGRIVNISSMAVSANLEGQSAYVASKAAVEGLTKVLAAEYADYGITVNAVCPPPTDTDMTRGISPNILKRTIDRMGMQSLATVDDVLPLLETLIGDGSEKINGQILHSDR